MDSEPVFRFGATMILKQAGIQASAIEVGELVQRVASGADRPGGVVLDASLGAGPYGVDTVAALSSASPELAIVVTVGRLRPSGLVEVLEAGALALLDRRCTAEELLAAVGAAAAGRNWVASSLAGSVRAELLSETSGDEALTSRELDVLRGMAVGATNAAIAARLGISENTVRNHVHAVLGKFGVANRTDAVVSAARRGLVDLSG